MISVTEKLPVSYETAIFAGGCFWCIAAAFDKLPGILSVISGYTGGHTQNPTYEEVCTESTGHKEAIQVTFDSRQITYDQLLDIYWRNIDPFDAEGQFSDKGDSYKTVIFYMNDIQKDKAQVSKKKWETTLKRAIVTEIKPAVTFYPAEDYHQNYAKKNPTQYEFYHCASGREERLREIWEKK